MTDAERQDPCPALIRHDDALSYIAAMLSELAEIARRARLQDLVHLIEMARLDAERAAMRGKWRKRH